MINISYRFLIKTFLEEHVARKTIGNYGFEKAAEFTVDFFIGN